MNSTEQEHTATSIHWPSVLQFTFSILALIGLWSIALILVAFVFIQQYFPIIEQNDPSAPVVMAALNFSVGMIVLFPIVFSGARLLNQVNRVNDIWYKFFSILHPRRIIWLLPLILFIGYWISKQGFSWWLLPVFHVIATFIPLIWLVWFAGRGLKKGSPQRDWGVFSSGLVLGPSLGVVIEFFAALVISISFGLYLSQNVELMEGIQRITVNLMDVQPGSDRFYQELGDILNSRLFVSLTIVCLAVLVPLIEEIIKPIGVWLLSGRVLSSQDGLFIGMLSGAGFALFENLSSFNGESGWVMMVLMRVTTTVMHMCTAGFTGWALAGAFREKKYLRLIGAFLLSVSIHALWNANAVLFAFTIVLYNLPGLSSPPVLPHHLQFSSPIILCYMAFAAFTWMIMANKHIREKEVVELALGSKPDYPVGE